MASTIKEFYRTSHIFITGGTGFVGIALLEKLLRDVPFEKVYLLLRPKKGMSVEERLKQVLDNKIIKALNLDESETVKKFVLISGDIEQDNLGISEEQTQLIQSNVTVVIHSAASLDFGGSMKETGRANLLGTRRVLNLCAGMKKLKAMVHVSSAYANANLKFAEEIIYPTPGDAEKVIQMIEEVPEEELVKNAAELLGSHINMYTFTKALAEHEVAKANSRHPTAIIRPSMIVGAWLEPVPGWTISRNGPQGFFMGAANGVVRRLPVDKDLIYDYIPIDVVVNHILVAAWIVDAKKPATTPVYHATSSTNNPFRWNCLLNQMTAVLHDYPSAKAIWYPTLKLLPSILIYRISSIIFHFLPALFFDAMLKVTGQRPKLIRLHRTINKSLHLLEPFIFNEWKFDNKNAMALELEVPSEEKETFYLNISKLDWDHFFYNLAKGVRRYLMNEDDKTIEAAKRKDRRFMVMNILVQILFFYVLTLTLQFVTQGGFYSALMFSLPLFVSIMYFL
uniref:Fatty acyl-CoA reductase n=1 Tax=Cacopsylla melanoneura TaxID=428564 RepID=A0A8D8ZIX0_9HEMI